MHLRRSPLDDDSLALTARGARLAGDARTHVFPRVDLQSERLRLRPFELADAPDVLEACSDPLTNRWLPLPRPYTSNVAAAWCTRITERLRDTGDGVYFALVPKTDRLVGCAGLKRTDWAALVSEISYWVSPWARGQGYASEAVRAIASWLLGDLQFERLELRVATANTESIRVAEKAGFRREGVMRNAGFIHEGRVDLALYSLIRPDLNKYGDGVT